MRVHTHPDFDGHDEVACFHDRETGLDAIVAIHRAWSQPSAGGCRARDYANSEEAMADVLRLSRAMTYKSVMAGLDYGGGKAVMLGVPAARTRAAAFRAMGRFVDSFDGRFRTGVDVGITADDVRTMGEVTPFMVGTGAVEPAALTAEGVVIAIRCAARRRLRVDRLRGLRVAVQGLGKVGLRLAGLLVAEGAVVQGSDVSDDACRRASELGAGIVGPERVHALDVDVFSPCALGAVLNDETIPAIRAPIITGAANNQLESASHAHLLHERNILHAPGYVANAGGLIAVAMQLGGHDSEWAHDKLDDLDATLEEVFDEAERTGRPADEAAAAIAVRRMNALSERHRRAA